MRLVKETFLFGEVLGHRLSFTSDEVEILKRASAIAEEARKFPLDEDSDMLLAEIEHGCQDLVEDPRGFRVVDYDTSVKD